MSKKRKKPNHVRLRKEEKEARKSKMEKFLNNYMWAITLVILGVLLAAAFILIPNCNASCKPNDPGNTNPGVSDSDEEAGDPGQLEIPEPGERVAVLHVSDGGDIAGDIKIRLFPDLTPKTCENFVGLIEQGKYNGTIFHRVGSEFMIQGGDYENFNGTGGQSIWGAPFEDEFGTGLYNYRGAVSMANSGPNSNGSQFFIVQSHTAAGVPETLPLWASDFYGALGGYPSLDGRHTVFGQVYEGMDLVDMIAAVPGQEIVGVGGVIPDVPITILSAEIITIE